MGVGAVLNSKTALLKRQPDAAPEIIAVLAKVYADVGKQDWPHAFPSFFESIYQLLQER